MVLSWGPTTVVDILSLGMHFLALIWWRGPSLRGSRALRGRHNALSSQLAQLTHAQKLL